MTGFHFHIAVIFQKQQIFPRNAFIVCFWCAVGPVFGGDHAFPPPADKVDIIRQFRVAAGQRDDHMHQFIRGDVAFFPFPQLTTDFQQKPQRVKNQPFLDPLRALPLGLHLRVGQMKALDGNRRELRLRDFMVCDLSAKIGQPNLAGAIPRCDQIERPPILAGIADQITASGPPRQIYINGILGIVGQRP